MKKVVMLFSSAVSLIVLVALAFQGCSKNRGASLPPPPVPMDLPGGLCPAPVPSVNTQVSQTSGDANNPVVISKGRGFFVAWQDWFGRYPTISGVEVDDGGLPQTEVTYFPGEKKCSDASVSADGDSVYLSWIDGSTARLARVGLKDAAIGSFGKTVKNVVAGAYGALLWEERGTLNFRGDGRLGFPDDDGAVPEPMPTVVAEGGIESPDIAWTGEFYAVVWSASISGGRDIMLQRVTNDGSRLGPAVKVSGVSGHNNRPKIVWTGTDFAVAWTNAAPTEDNPNGNYRIFLSVIPEKGVRPVMTRQLEFNGSADVVSLATTGTELALAWVGTKAPAGSAVYFRRLDMKGNLVGDQIRVSDDQPIAVGRPDIAFGKGGYAIVWHDSRDFEGAEIFFSFLACSASEAPAVDTDAVEADSQPSELKDVF